MSKTEPTSVVVVPNGEKQKISFVVEEEIRCNCVFYIQNVFFTLLYITIICVPFANAGLTNYYSVNNSTLFGSGIETYNYAAEGTVIPLIVLSTIAYITCKCNEYKSKCLFFTFLVYYCFVLAFMFYGCNLVWNEWNGVELDNLKKLTIASLFLKLTYFFFLPKFWEVFIESDVKDYTR